MSQISHYIGPHDTARVRALYESGTISCTGDDISRAFCERDKLRELLAELVDGIDRWNTAVAEIVDVSKVPKWQGLEDARAFLAGKKSQ